MPTDCSSSPEPSTSGTCASRFSTIDGENFEILRDALQTLRLNDASLTYEPETSQALSFGFRCGFLGLLHMEIVQERLEREYGLDLIATVPSVRYKVGLTDGSAHDNENPSSLADQRLIEKVEEPIVTAQIVTPLEYMDAIMRLVKERRGTYRESEMLDSRRTIITCDLPLAEILVDFHDRVKSLSRGYASFDYDFSGYRAADLVRLDILVNEEPVDALSVIVHRDKAYRWGREIAANLKDLIPRQLFQVAIQAAVGSRVIARENISALRKNVTAKCYGGDITRKRKLLERQREGKRRMKSVGVQSLAARELALLGRLHSGAEAVGSLAAEHGCPVYRAAPLLDHLRAEGIVVRDGKEVRLSPKGMLASDAVIADLTAALTLS